MGLGESGFVGCQGLCNLGVLLKEDERIFLQENLYKSTCKQCWGLPQGFRRSPWKAKKVVRF